MDSIYLTLPVTILLAAILVALVIRSVRRGEMDDPEGPKYRMLYDDDDPPPPPDLDAPPPAPEIPAKEER